MGEGLSKGRAMLRLRWPASNTWGTDMTNITQSRRDTGLRMSIAWPFFVRLPRCFRPNAEPARPRLRDTPAHLRSKVERDIALFARTSAPLTRYTRH